MNASSLTLQSFGRALKYSLSILVLAFSLMGFHTSAHAAIEVYEFNSPSQEAQYKALIEEFRCPKCQNQNLAGSDSQIAQDLKRKTYEMVIAGQSDAQIREYMYERYGDFISYKPPVRPSTWILWYFPPLILILLVAGWLWRTKQGQRNKALATAQAAQSDTKAASRLTDADKIESELSSEEAAKLNALLRKHGSTSDANSPTKRSDSDLK
nr:cytochrome c-type biogenesis protein [Psychrobacter sp. H7-1]